jgi:hypothetical protein
MMLFPEEKWAGVEGIATAVGFVSVWHSMPYVRAPIVAVVLMDTRPLFP